jgi:hypothetical protein
MTQRTDLVDWQVCQEGTRLVKCWWTHPFLDWMDTQDFSGKRWLEFGAGLGTAWLRSRCKWVDSIEASRDWAEKAAYECHQFNKLNGTIYAYEENLRDGMAWEDLPKYMTLIPEGKRYNVISVDGIYRTEIMGWAVEHLKSNGGGLLVADNFDQDYVWISPAAEEIVKPFKHTEKVFYQPNHIAHEGKPWNTRYWVIK